MFKKVLTLLLVLAGAFTMTACKDGEDPVVELTALEKISEAMDQLELPSSASTDLTLLDSGLHDVVITWESDNEDVIATDGTVTIPLFTDGDQTVTLTAYLALDGQTLTKTFEIDVLAATVKTDAEKVHEAAVAFNGLVSGNIIADITLPTTGQHDSTVVWASSHPEYVSTEGVVVRPAEGADNVVVTLTGTVTVGEATEDVVLTVTVVAEESATVYADIATLYANAIIDDYIEFTGTVVATFSGGYFLTDGTHSLGIYKGSGTHAVNPVVGDEVRVKGFYAVYNTLYQLSGLVEEEVLSSGNANPLTPTVATVAEINALDATDKTIHGMPYTVSGTLQKIEDGGYTNTWLVDGENKFQIYHYSNDDSLDVLDAYIGVDVTFTGYYYTFYKDAKVYFMFDGGAEDVSANLTPQEAYDGDLNVLAENWPIVSLEDVTLPTLGNNGTTFTGWTSSNTAIYSDAGVFAAIGAATETVTFTGTATSADGTITGTVTIDVVVPVLSTIEQVLAMEKDDFFQVSGTVYAQYSGGFYLENGGFYIFVYSYNVSGAVTEGDNITLLGQLGSYNGLTQVYPQSDATVNSSGNTPNVAQVTGVVGDLLVDTYLPGTKVTVTGTVSIEGDNDNAFITDVAGNKVEVYYKSDADVIKTFDGQVITVELMGYTGSRVLFFGEAADITTGATYSDAEKAAAVAAALDLGDLSAVSVDLTLPLTWADPAATIVWGTSDAAVVTDAGVINMVSGSTPSATLTATVTVGTETATREFVVTLLDLDDSAPMTVSEALALTDGTVVVVQGVVVGVYYDEVILQDSTGAAIYVDSNIGADLGDEIVVVGTLGLNDSWGDNQRELYSASLVEEVATGVALVTSTETDPAVIVTETPSMFRYTATLTITKLNDGHGYALFNTDVDDENGLKMKLSTEVPEYFEDYYQVGDTIELTFTVSDIDYSNTRVVSVVGFPTLTDAELLTLVSTVVGVESPVTADLTPVTEMYGVAIAWATSDAAVIALDGTVTRPAVGEPDATVTLTATFSIGTETPVSVDYVVTVPATPAPVSYDYTETFTNFSGTGSYADGNFVGDNSITWTYTVSRGDQTINGQAFCLRNGSYNPSLTATITGGIDAFTVNFRDAFSGSGQLIIVINEGLATEATFTSSVVDFDGSGDVEVFSAEGIAIEGDFTISIYSGEAQVAFDDFQWASYSAS